MAKQEWLRTFLSLPNGIPSHDTFGRVFPLLDVEKIHDHGRVESRRYTLISASDPLMFQVRSPAMKSIGMLEVTRTTNNEVERSKRFFISSLDEDIDGFMKASRKHWSIEINVHWSLDVSFREDHNRA